MKEEAGEGACDAGMQELLGVWCTCMCRACLLTAAVGRPQVHQVGLNSKLDQDSKHRVFLVKKQIEA